MRNELMIALAIALSACGANGISARHSEPNIVGTGAGTIFSFTDSSAPVLQNSGVTIELNNVFFGGPGAGLFVVVGTGGVILTSPDSVNWTSHESTTEVDLYGVTYGDGQFVAVGGEDVNGVGVVLNSPDGITWTTDDSFDGGPLTGVNFANNEFVAVGSNQVVSSPDGIMWSGPDDATSGITSDTVDLFNSAFGNGLFVTVGTYNKTSSKSDVPYEGLIATSTDASNWNVLTPYQSNYLSGLTYGGGQFVTVGREGLILTSPDGTSWTTQTAPGLDATKTPYLIDVTYSGTQYVVTGNYVGENPVTGFIMTSPDAKTWSVQPTGANVYGVAYGVVGGVGTYVAVGGA